MVHKIIKAILLMLTFNISLFFSITFSNRYGPHSVSYSNNGVTNCDDDNDGISDPVCVQIGSEPTVGGTTCPSGPVSVASEGNMTCWYWDGQAPTIDNLTLKVNGKLSDSNLLATNNATVTFTYNDNGGGGSPKITIYYQLEKYDSNNSYLSESSVTLTTNNSTASTNISWNISHVLPTQDFDSSIGGRQYSIKITKICDSAKNCITPNKVYTWNVFANSPLGYEIKNFSDFNNEKIANNSDLFSGGVLLKDQYGNPIFPAPGIHRNIKFTLKYSNNVYLNQYKLNGGSGIKGAFKGDSLNFLNISSTTSLEKTYSSLDSSLYDGYYYLNFSSYVPTYDGYNKAYGRVNLISLKYDLSDDLLGNKYDEFSINKYLKFKPQVLTHISGIPPLAAEGTYKDFNISFTQNSTNYSDITFMVQFDPKGSDLDTYLAYNSTTNWGKYAIYGYKGNSLISNLYLGAANKIGTFSSLTDINKPFYEKAVLKENGVLDPNNQGVISTHIAVKYSDGTVAVWNSDLVGANNYNYNSTLDDYLVQSAIYVNGLIGVSGLAKDKLQTILSGQVFNQMGVVNKPKLRAKFHRLMSSILYGNKFKNWLSSDTFDIWNNNPQFTYRGVKVYYLVNEGGNKVIIPGKIGLNDKVLLVTKGVSVFIDGDITTTKNGIFGIISLDTDPNDIGNIYIKNTVTNLDAYIYTDKAVITYKGNPLGTFVTQESLSQDDLKNQLFIKGVLWSFNVAGASKSGICPYFNKNCTSPRKYDIDYLRRFYMIKANVIDPTSGSNYYVPYGITSSISDSNDTILIGGIKCELTDCNSDGKKEAFCKDTDSSLYNLLNISSSGKCNPFINLQNNKDLQHKLAPVYIEYDPRINNMYLPGFSSFVR